MRSVSMQIRKQDQDISHTWLDEEIIKRPFFHMKFPSQKVKLSTPITFANCISVCLPAHCCCCFQRKKEKKQMITSSPTSVIQDGQTFSNLTLVFSTALKILAAKTSLLTWLAIPRLFFFFLQVLFLFSSLQTDKSTSCVARMSCSTIWPFKTLFDVCFSKIYFLVLPVRPGT